MKNSKSLLLIFLLTILLMATAYSTFATQLKLNGTAQIIGEWNVKITGVTSSQISDGCDAGPLQFTNTSATFNAKLRKPGDVITYIITIENKGTIDAKLNDVIFYSDENDSPIIYTKTDPKELLKVGEKTTFTVTVTYDSNFQDELIERTKTVTGVLEYVQA